MRKLVHSPNYYKVHRQYTDNTYVLYYIGKTLTTFCLLHALQSRDCPCNNDIINEDNELGQVEQEEGK